MKAKIASIFRSTRSMDVASSKIDALLAGNTLETSILWWYEIFLNADFLGKQLGTPPQIRGRAGEKVLQYICEYIKHSFPNETIHGFHSLHLEGTELDYLLITPWAFFFIEAKSMKSTQASHSKKIVTDATSQNKMHMDRFEKFINKKFPGCADTIIAVPMIVTTHKGDSNDLFSQHNSHLVTHITDLAPTLYKRICAGIKNNASISDYKSISTYLYNYYNSPEHQSNITAKKKKGGYV